MTSWLFVKKFERFSRLFIIMLYVRGQARWNDEPVLMKIKLDKSAKKMETMYEFIDNGAYYKILYGPSAFR